MFLKNCYVSFAKNYKDGEPSRSLEDTNFIFSQCEYRYNLHCPDIAGLLQNPLKLMRKNEVLKPSFKSLFIKYRMSMNTVTYYLEFDHLGYGW